VKLFEFEDGAWANKGIGLIKLLKARDTGKTRLGMLSYYFCSFAYLCSDACGRSRKRAVERANYPEYGSELSPSQEYSIRWSECQERRRVIGSLMLFSNAISESSFPLLFFLFYYLLLYFICIILYDIFFFLF
jgi:hypothetical protein